MGRLIINADDLGSSHGVNMGILYAYKKGIVNSSSLIVTHPGFEEAVQLISEHHLPNIGIHFNLTEGKSVLSGHSTITDSRGDFYRNIYEMNEVDFEEVMRELAAQYEKAVGAGVAITHMDTHHHLHMTLKFRKIFAEFSKTHGLPLRKVHPSSRNPLKRLSLMLDMWGVNYYTDYFNADFYDQNATEGVLKGIINAYKGKSVEIMCHPGYSDIINGEYNELREKELAILVSPEFNEQ